MNVLPTQVVLLGSSEYDAIVDTLCAAFYDYPVMRFVLGDVGDEYAEQLRTLVHFFVMALPFGKYAFVVGRHYLDELFQHPVPTAQDVGGHGAAGVFLMFGDQLL